MLLHSDKFAGKTLLENYKRLKECCRDRVGLGTGFVREDYEDDPGEYDTEMLSDIQNTWTDAIEARDDIRNFLVWLHGDAGDEFAVSDMMDAIMAGVNDAKKVLNI